MSLSVRLLVLLYHGGVLELVWGLTRFSLGGDCWPLKLGLLSHFDIGLSTVTPAVSLCLEYNHLYIRVIMDQCDVRQYIVEVLKVLPSFSLLDSWLLTVRIHCCSVLSCHLA